MKIKTPIEVLTEELSGYQKALDKSTQAHNEGKIDICLHEIHIRNLKPKIELFTKAINVLIKHYDEY
jgi:hypothetical protein